MTLTTDELAQIETRIAQYQSMNRVVDMYCLNHSTLTAIRYEIQHNGSNEILDKALALAERTNERCEEILYQTN